MASHYDESVRRDSMCMAWRCSSGCSVAYAQCSKAATNVQTKLGFKLWVCLNSWMKHIACRQWMS
jgi:hypothetical protein